MDTINIQEQYEIIPFPHLVYSWRVNCSPGYEDHIIYRVGKDIITTRIERYEFIRTISWGGRLWLKVKDVSVWEYDDRYEEKDMIRHVDRIIMKDMLRKRVEFNDVHLELQYSPSLIGHVNNFATEAKVHFDSMKQ